MRRAKEVRVWRELQEGAASATPAPFGISATASIDLARPCTILGGNNGSGKSRLLKRISNADPDGTLYLDLHRLCEQALSVLRPIKNLAEMKEELGRIGPNDERADDARRIVGRTYDTMDWFALDIGPDDEEVVERFRWGGDDPLFPYFIVSYKGVEYDALDMGLGEFSVHFLLWILEQYRDREDLLVLLDEPDAYLPPVGVERLLVRLLAICQKRGWRMIVSTHSEEMISSAVEHGEFLRVRMGEGGESEATHSRTDGAIADTLLTRPPFERVVFVEDEAAWYLARALLNKADRGLSLATSLIWGDGEGSLRKLREKVPRPARPEIAFGFLPDGDQRSKMSSSPIAGRWPVHFLPTDQDPDSLFRSLQESPDSLATALGVNQQELQRKLDAMEGEDDHDWVNLLGEAYGRAHVLAVLAASWAESHLDEASALAKAVSSLR